MVDAVYRGNIEELLSVINYLKKYIIVFVIVLLILLSVFHFSENTVQVVPLITVTLVLLPAVYYTTVLVLKIGPCVLASYQNADAATMDADAGRRHDALKTPERPYPNSPTPPPSYEEATRNDQQQYRGQQHYHTAPWLPSTSSGYTSGGVVFNVEHQYRYGGDAAVWAPPPPPPPPQTHPQPQSHAQPQTHAQPSAAETHPQPHTHAQPSAAETQPQQQTRTPTPQQLSSGPTPPMPKAAIKNIPCVTITMDDDHSGSVEI